MNEVFPSIALGLVTRVAVFILVPPQGRKLVQIDFKLCPLPSQMVELHAALTLRSSSLSPEALDRSTAVARDFAPTVVTGLEDIWTVLERHVNILIFLRRGK